MFNLLARRIVKDLHLTPLVFDALALQMTTAEVVLLVESLDLIYFHRCPPPKADG